MNVDELNEFLKLHLKSTDVKSWAMNKFLDEVFDGPSVKVGPVTFRHINVKNTSNYKPASWDYDPSHEFELIFMAESISGERYFKLDGYHTSWDNTYYWPPVEVERVETPVTEIVVTWEEV